MEEVVFFLLILCSLPSIASSSQTDTLKQGDTLNSSASLVSANNNFTLGFFTPEGTNRTYLAIKCRACDSSDPVWIGNRETPLPTNSSATLQIDASGRLILTHTGEGQDNPYLVLSSKQTSLKVEATLLNSGNFVLREVNGEEVWSSFDNPTDTLFPGMKLGVNHRTGRKWSLTSWLNDTSPAHGAFSLEWEPIKRQLVIKHRGVAHWSSGELMNATHFQHLFFDYIIFNVQLHNISTKTEDYFTNADDKLNRSNIPGDLHDRFLTLMSLDPRGLVYDANSRLDIIDAGECYGYENKTLESKGCEIWHQPACRGGWPNVSGKIWVLL